MTRRVVKAGRGRSKWVLESKHEAEARQEQSPTTHERLQIAGVNLARASARIRELEHEVGKWRWANELDPVIARMTVDELAIVKGLVAKLMGEGRTEHGPLNLALDKRDLLKEAADELDDTMAYLMMERRRLEFLRRNSD